MSEIDEKLKKLPQWARNYIADISQRLAQAEQSRDEWESKALDPARAMSEVPGSPSIEILSQTSSRFDEIQIMSDAVVYRLPDPQHPIPNKIRVKVSNWVLGEDSCDALSIMCDHGRLEIVALSSNSIWVRVARA